MASRADLDFRNPFIPVGQSPQIFIGRHISEDILILLARCYRNAGAEISNLPDPNADPSGPHAILADCRRFEARHVS